MTPEEWTRWKNNRTTKKFFKYVSDFREQAARELSAFIADGISVSKEDLDKVTLQCLLYRDFEELQCEDITSFYEPEKEEDDDGENDSHRPEDDKTD